MKVAGGVWLGVPTYLVLAQWLFNWWDPPPTFYDATAQVSAAFLIALALTLRLEAPSTSGTRQQLAGAVLGFSLAVAVSLMASLTALARESGSELLFTVTAGGLITATILLVLVAVTRVPDPAPAV